MKNQFTFGSWLTLANTETAEIMAQSGFDWLAVDMEHSAVTLKVALDMIRVVESYNVVPLVRVGDNDSYLIKRVMDAGAYGVIVPQVNSKQEAEKAVASVKYPPKGTRGVGLWRAQGYGTDFKQYKDWVNKESIVIVQVEHIKAVENLESILKVEDIDAFIVGPYDLSASLGIPGEFDNPKVQAALKRIMEVAKKLKKPAGFHVIPPNPDLLLEKVKEGYRFLGLSLDELHLKTFCQTQVASIRRNIKKL